MHCLEIDVLMRKLCLCVQILLYVHSKQHNEHICILSTAIIIIIIFIITYLSWMTYMPCYAY